MQVRWESHKDMVDVGGRTVEVVWVVCGEFGGVMYYVEAAELFVKFHKEVVCLWRSTMVDFLTCCLIKSGLLGIRPMILTLLEFRDVIERDRLICTGCVEEKQSHSRQFWDCCFLSFLEMEVVVVLRGG